MYFIPMVIYSAIVNILCATNCERVLLDKRGESIIASRGNLIGNIDIYDTMIIEMDVAIGVLDSSGETWESVFHIGNENGQRYPGIWFHSTAGAEGSFDGFTLSYAEDSNSNNYVGQTAAGGAFTNNMVVSYKSVQTQTQLTITENGAILFDEAYTSHPTPTGVNVYVGDPWYGPADVTITNLVIKGYNPNECCAAVDIDGFLDSCSTLWDDNTGIIGTINSDIGTLQTDVSTNAASIQTNAENINTGTQNVGTNAANIQTNAESISSLETELATFKTETEQNFQDISNPSFSAQAVGGGLDTFSDADKFLGLDNKVFLLISLLANFILVSFGCYIVSNARKNNLYNKVASYVESDTEQPLQRR